MLKRQSLLSKLLLLARALWKCEVHHVKLLRMLRESFFLNCSSMSEVFYLRNSKALIVVLLSLGREALRTVIPLHYTSI